MRALVLSLFWLFTRAVSQVGCPCTDAPKENDLFQENPDYHSLRTLCLVRGGVGDPVMSKIYSVIEKFEGVELEIPQSVGNSRLRISSIAALNVSTNLYGNTVCDATMKIVSDRNMSIDDKKKMRTSHYNSCPGLCLVVPHVEIPISIIDKWLNIGSFHSWSSSQQQQVG